MIIRSENVIHNNEHGFTLVELMVVIVIMGLMAAVVVLSFPDSNGQPDQDARKFAVRTAALRDNAILQSRPMAVQVTSSGYSFLERRKGSWSVVEDKPFRSTSWSEGVEVALDDSGSLLISFESTGLPGDQAKVILVAGDLERSISIAPMGEVRLSEVAK